MTLTPTDYVVFGALAIACYTDLRWRWVPNALTLPLVGVGLLLGGLQGHLQQSLVGFGAAFALHFTLWVLQIQKGGDSKLMMGIGACVGAPMMLETTLWKYVVFLPIGLGVLAARGRLGNLVAAMRWTLDKARGLPVGERPEPTYMAYAPAIALGFLLARFTGVFDFFS